MILAILQARTTSSRLPNKVLKSILGKPMLAHQIERVKRSRLIDNLVVATSTDSSDNALLDLCRCLGVECFRGNLDDVLDRFYQAALPYKPDHIVRLTGDCPLIDPNIIDMVIKFHVNGNYDYSSNCLEPTYPDGLDTEVFKYKCLFEAWQEAKLKSEREHVTPFINKQSNRYKLGCLKSPIDYSSLRWTVDESADFEFVSQIYSAIYPDNPLFAFEDILNLLESMPDLRQINAGINRNEGYMNSLKNDGIFATKGVN